MVNRQPNCKCAMCDKPIYRRASTLKRLANPPCCSTACANRQRGTDHLHTPEVVALRAAKMTGANNPAWMGGRYIEPDKGYVMIRRPDHPRARQNGYVLEHILVAEEKLGRALLPDEEIHHKNEIRSDNRPDNLEVYASHNEHWIPNHVPLRPKSPPCRCGQAHFARGMCSRCYAYWRRTGKDRPLGSGDLRVRQPVCS